MKEKSFERKNELIAAAFDEFTLNSYENASLNNIIKTAGISKGTFYYNFENKMELYLSMVEIAGRNQVEFINKYIKEQNVEAKDIFEELKLQFLMSGKFAITHPKYYRFIIMFVKEMEINKDLKSAFADSNDSLLDVLIKKAIKNGDFNNRFSNDFIKKIMQYLFTNYFGIFIEEKDYELEKMLENANNFVDFIKYGLGNKEE
ncbi:TetR/AcrR family transcriptional regulator [Methanobacterium sp.]|uniref:TetR/AcrR family transcriptional regulator n=1 Tax=Methanobacterium sp. TaxID=2164 RepID=UPI003C742F79